MPMVMLHFESEQDAFARGGNRLCFVDPRNSNHCVKVASPERAPAIKKSQQAFPMSLKPLRCFDDNEEEHRIYQYIQRQIGESAYELIPRCFGFVDTNFGRGLCSEIITDSDGKISVTLKQYVWQFGFTEELKAAVAYFQRQWSLLGMPSRNLLLHNIVVQQDSTKIIRLVVIDGLGWSDLIPLAYWFPVLAKSKASRKASRLTDKIAELLAVKEQGGDWGYHGWMDEEKRTISGK